MRAFSEWTFPQGTLATVAFLAALAVPTARAETPSSILQSLPDEVQKHIEEVRASCREHVKGMGTDPSQSWISPWANEVNRVSSGDDGLRVFTVSGAQAVMVSELELCGGQCLRGTNCSNRGSYNIVIYVKSGYGWEEALSTDAVGNVFLSTDWLHDEKFNVLVLSVFGGNKYCPTHDVPMRDGQESYVFPAWKQSCDAVVKWDGKKFTYKPL